jgi:hypothetical protein
LRERGGSGRRRMRRSFSEKRGRPERGDPLLRRGTAPCGLASFNSFSAPDLFLFSSGPLPPTMAHEDQSPPAARGMTASIPAQIERRPNGRRSLFPIRYPVLAGRIRLVA